MEEILIITNYYPPEKGAAANRIEQLALKLTENNYSVSIICPLPNYPKGKLFNDYKGKFTVTENKNNCTIKRLWIYPSVSKNIFIRLISTLSFSTSLFFYLIFKKTPKKTIVQSPPLLLSFISIFILNLKRKKIILNVSDLWPLAAIELNVLKKGSFSYKFSLFIERFIYKKASLILGQSNEILNHIQSIFPKKECFLYRNFPEHNVLEMELKTIENEPIKLFYAGLLGVAQGIFELCKKIELENLNIELHLFGDGADKMKIEQYIKTNHQKKIFFHGMLERDDLHKKINTFDIALVPLKTRIYGSVPSKIFEYSSLGFPILYFGGGEGETIVLENKLGWVAPVGHFNLLNETIITVSKLKKVELELMKKEVFLKSKNCFNLEEQFLSLLKTEVF